MTAGATSTYSGQLWATSCLHDFRYGFFVFPILISPFFDAASRNLFTPNAAKLFLLNVYKLVLRKAFFCNKFFSTTSYCHYYSVQMYAFGLTIITKRWTILISKFDHIRIIHLFCRIILQTISCNIFFPLFQKNTDHHSISIGGCSSPFVR